jgi:hypothetical protein
MLNVMLLLALAGELATEPQRCAAMGDGHYACPDAESLLVPAEGEEITIHVYAPDAGSGDGWECRSGWCEMDYGLVTDDDVLEAPPGASGGGCEPQPGPTPPAPPKRRPIFIKVTGPDGEY